MPINYKIKILFFALFLIFILSFLAVGANYAKTAKNIYEFENLSGIEIIGQIKQMVLAGDVSLKTDQEGKTSVLILGIAGPGHSGENLTDTIMVLTISADQRSVVVSSIPRDLYIELPEGQKWSKINAVYAYYGKNDPKQGIKALAEEVRKITGISINYYIVADFEGFKKLIDEAGGIDYTLETDLYDPNFPDSNAGYDPLFLKAGAYHLDGNLALKLSRSRYTMKGDFSRIDRQHKIIKALEEKLKQKKIWGNFFAVNNILNIISEHIKTNITIPEMKKLSDIDKNGDEIKIKSKIPDAGEESELLKAAKAGEADILLTKDPSYEELKRFYQE